MNPYHRILTAETLRALQRLSTDEVCPVGSGVLLVGYVEALVQVGWVERAPCALSRYGGVRLTAAGRELCRLAGFHPMGRVVNGG